MRRKWYLVIQGYDQTAPDNEEALRRGLEKIELAALHEYDALVEARACWTERATRAMTAPDGTRYPRSPKVVLAIEPDWVVEAPRAVWIPAPFVMPPPMDFQVFDPHHPPPFFEEGELDGGVFGGPREELRQNEEGYHVFVKADLPIWETIAEKFDEVNPRLINHSWSMGEVQGTIFGEVIVLVHFDRTMTVDEALVELEHRGLRPAELPELLGLAEAHPNLQHQYPIVALGTESFGNAHGQVKSYPEITGNDRVRRFKTHICTYPFSAHTRFAAVKK